MSFGAQWLLAASIAGVGLMACSGGLDSLTTGKDASANPSGGSSGSAGYDASSDAPVGTGGTAGSAGLGGSGATGGGGSGGSAGTTTGGAGGSAGAATGGSGGTAAGGTGGAPGTGGAGGAGGTGPGIVACGSSTCDMTAGDSCCMYFGVFVCGPSNKCSSSNTIACDGPEDCPGAQVCCAKLNGPGTQVRHVECLDQCGSSEKVICGGSTAACTTGKQCGPFPLLKGYTYCD